MGLFDQFPFLQTQELNLDWLMRSMKKLEGIYENLQKEIQDTIDFVNNFEKHADELIDERVAVALSQYNLRLLNIESELQKLWEELNKEDGVQGQIDSLNAIVADLQNQITNLQHMIRSEIMEVYDLMHQYKHDIDFIIDGKEQELERYVYSIVTRLDRLDIVNPMNGVLENIQNVINDIWTVVSRSYGITAEQFDSLKLTAHDFDAIRITAQDYDTRGYFELYMEFTFTLVRSPFTGGMVTFQTIVDDLANLHKCAITAQEYDVMELTAEIYDMMQIPAFSYDWFGNIVARPITAKRYDDLLMKAQSYDDLQVTAERYSQGMGALISTSLSGCDHPCGDYQILAGQISGMSTQIAEMQEQVNRIQPITVSAGTSYVGMVDFGSVSSFVSIPSLLDDSVVSISAGASVLPTVVDVQPKRGVQTTWPADATKVDALSYTVSVSNRKN